MTTPWSARLRDELCSQAAVYAADSGATAYRSLGGAGVTLFPIAADGTSHGNFISPSFEAITGDKSWRERLKKAHTSRRTALPEPHNESARELDSCTSSDALLMNVFCYPNVLSNGIAKLMGVSSGARPEFGVPGLVPLADGRADSTELDMRLGAVQVEAKLTEADFTRRPKSHVERYAGLYTVFEKAALPGDETDYFSYQLIRNVLSVAAKPDNRFMLLLDGRRPDLLHEWWSIHGAVRDAELRQRCGFVLWQELAAAAPKSLRHFLQTKYGL